MSRRALNGFQPQALEAAREAAQMTRGTLARHVGVDPTSVHNWETGRAAPQPDLLARAANILGVSIETLVVVTDSMRTLSDLRILAGLTQRQLADQIACSDTTLGRLERGEARLTDALAEKIARALELETTTITDAYRRARERPPRT